MDEFDFGARIRPETMNFMNDTNLTTVFKKTPVGAKLKGGTPNGRKNIEKFRIEFVEIEVRVSYI